MNPVKQHYEIILDRSHPDGPNITVEADSRTGVKIVLNANKIYNSMAQKDTILVALNEKITDLLQRHIDKQAEQESALRAGR